MKSQVRTCDGLLAPYTFRAAELRLRTGAHRSVRTRSVTFADDSLTMITATPCPPGRGSRLS